MEGDLHIVNFEEWCPKCAHNGKESWEDPCDECLGIPARPDSRKPERWKKDHKKKRT